MAKPLVDSVAIRSFFAWSDRLDHDVLRPLSHVRANWELWWDATSQRYETEDGHAPMRRRSYHPLNPPWDTHRTEHIGYDHTTF